ncbi:hypothetical protein PUN28_007940 [Cardiocondyla obscurior]|uniref:Uncharacterized protein n=1 Tax=Cardiocondyla obscurior TaxID=286306 RepID=A0AAW2FYD0_9HYME
MAPYPRRTPRDVARTADAPRLSVGRTRACSRGARGRGARTSAFSGPRGTRRKAVNKRRATRPRSRERERERNDGDGGGGGGGSGDVDDDDDDGRVVSIRGRGKPAARRPRESFFFAFSPSLPRVSSFSFPPRTARLSTRPRTRAPFSSEGVPRVPRVPRDRSGVPIPFTSLPFPV